jgi:hypothetical protein
MKESYPSFSKGIGSKVQLTFPLRVAYLNGNFGTYFKGRILGKLYI